MLARTILIARASRQSARQATAPAHIAAQCSWLHTSAPSAHDGPGPGPPHRSPSSDQQRRRAPFGEQREQRNQQPNHSSSSPYGNRSNNIGNAHNGDGYPPRHQRGPRPPAGPGSRARPGSREARFGGGGPVPSPRDWASGGRPGAGAKSELREERFGERAGGSSASASGSGPLRSFQGGSRERATPSASSDTADPVPEESLGNDRNGTDTRGPSQRGKGQVKKTGRGSLLDSVHESRNGDGKRGKGKERDAGGGGQATKHGKGTTKGKGKESRGKMQKEVQKQVFLPGVIAVSNLARVLGIKLRECLLPVCSTLRESRYRCAIEHFRSASSAKRLGATEQGMRAPRNTQTDARLPPLGPSLGGQLSTR